MDRRETRDLIIPVNIQPGCVRLYYMNVTDLRSEVFLIDNHTFGTYPTLTLLRTTPEINSVVPS